MKSIQSDNYLIHFNTNSYSELNSYLSKNIPTKIFILVDENSHKYCYPIFIQEIETTAVIEVIEIESGEDHKNIETCINLWHALTELGADRKSLLINLGGGVITDMGGFVASTFKRGINFINIPTTLLSMVDASVGSKTGVDLGTLKNLIGLFSDPKMVLVDTKFLNTVSKRELHSGLAEVIKYGLTYDINLWETIKKSNPLEANLDSIIYRSIEIKNEVVSKDLKENGLRKVLNFGHTIGHAIESYFLENNDKETLTHGEAIATGMVIESYFSCKLFNFPKEELVNIKSKIIELFGKTIILEEDYQPIIDLMKYDKKNIGNDVNFVLLKDLTKFNLDCKVPHKLLIEGLNYYNE